MSKQRRSCQKFASSSTEYDGNTETGDHKRLCWSAAGTFEDDRESWCATKPEPSVAGCAIDAKQDAQKYSAPREVSRPAGHGKQRAAGGEGSPMEWLKTKPLERYRALENLCRLKSREIIRETHMGSKLIVSKVGLHK